MTPVVLDQAGPASRDPGVVGGGEFSPIGDAGEAFPARVRPVSCASHSAGEVDGIEAELPSVADRVEMDRGVRQGRQAYPERFL